MTSKEINERALDLLDNRDWYNAQALFFQNARIAPSYKTYNNLGYYPGFESCEIANLNVEETPWTLFKGAIGW